jgi:hypothetical protein
MNVYLNKILALTCKKYLLGAFLLFLCTYSISQRPTKFYQKPDRPTIQSIGFRGGFGVIIPHRESMIHLVTGHIISSEIYLEKCGTIRNWNKIYRFPTCGVNFYYGYLASPDILGSAFAIDYYANLHLIKQKKFLFDMRLASGLGYLTKTFDAQENNHNVAIGSNMNISIGASFDLKFQLSRYWQLSTGLSLKHFSNGSFSTPNLGINIPVWMLGIKKILHSPWKEFAAIDTVEIKKLKAEHKNFQRYSATVGLGAKEIYPAGGNRYGTYSLELNAIHYFNFKSGISAGMDLIHNVALYKHARYLDTLSALSQKQFTQFAINIGYVQTFDNFELFIQNGFYILNKYNKDGGIYQRLGGRYYFNPNIVCHFALKTHFAKADYFEMGMGYYFNKGKSNEENVRAYF